MTAASELHSLSTVLSELVQRVGAITDALHGDDEDRFGAELREVERNLAAARRRLERALDRAR